MSAKILLVDDDKPTRKMVSNYLSREGFEVHLSSNADRALKMVHTLRPDLVVLDVLLPGMDGLELCRHLQREQELCVMMLSSRAELIDRIIGLSVGADDYLGKPCNPRELILRIKAILRRSRKSPPEPEKCARHFVGLSIDPARREVYYKSEQVSLTTREFDLLYALAQSSGLVLTRSQLLDRVWGLDFDGNDRVVDVHVGFLRRKLADDPNQPQLIHTIRGVGYKFVAQPV